MQLVDEGAVDLDAPLRCYLPEFRIADEGAAGQITVRQLLTHTAGFEGDIFTDTGAVTTRSRSTSASCTTSPSCSRRGSCGPTTTRGSCVLGRLVEVLARHAVRRVPARASVHPLGLTHAAHQPLRGDPVPRRGRAPRDRARRRATSPLPVWALVRSNAPAGSMLAMSPRGPSHLRPDAPRRRRAADGTRLLAPGTAARMHAHQVDLPDLGYAGRLVGARLRALRDARGARHRPRRRHHRPDVVPQDRAGRRRRRRAAHQRWRRHVALRRRRRPRSWRTSPTPCSRSLPMPPAEPTRIDGSRYLGTVLVRRGGADGHPGRGRRVWLAEVPEGHLRRSSATCPSTRSCVRYRDDTLIALEPEHGTHRLHAFLGDDGSGRSLFAHVGRAIRRAGVVGPSPATGVDRARAVSGLRSPSLLSDSGGKERIHGHVLPRLRRRRDRSPGSTGGVRSGSPRESCWRPRGSARGCGCSTWARA